MMEMQAIKNLHCTIWTEGVREIVSAKDADTKFILSDHPVTIYNHAYPPESPQCAYPKEPTTALKGTQTIFPLDIDHCLILTNLEYAKNPQDEDPTGKRTNPHFVRESMVRTDAFIRTRLLNSEDVAKINLVLKQRARRYIEAPNKEWLYPESRIGSDWAELGKRYLGTGHYDDVKAGDYDSIDKWGTPGRFMVSHVWHWWRDLGKPVGPLSKHD